MKILSIIPARGGSKTLANKNIKLFHGKPLIYWTIMPSMHTSLITTSIVSSDSEKIIECAQAYGIDVPFVRPECFATDNATSIDLVIHALDFFAKRKEFFDYVILLQPTSPLRTVEEIETMILSFVKNKDRFDSVVAVVKNTVPTEWVCEIQDDLLVKESQTPLRRQDTKATFIPCGMFYMAKVSELRRQKTFYTSRTMAWVVDDRHRFDIDDIYDFLAAEAIHRCFFESATWTYTI